MRFVMFALKVSACVAVCILLFCYMLHAFSNNLRPEPVAAFSSSGQPMTLGRRRSRWPRMKRRGHRKFRSCRFNHHKRAKHRK